MTKRIFLSLTLVFYCALISAQDTSDQDTDNQYVTDQLRLSLYANANSSSQVLKLLQSGDLLKIEQIQGPYALVTAPDGTRGWVKRGFLVTKPTFNILYRDELQKTEELTREIEKLANSKAVIDQYEKDMDELVGKIDQLEEEKQTATESIAELQLEVEAKQQEIDLKDEDSAPAWFVLSDTFQRYWAIIVPIIIAIIILSFLVSKLVIETRIKRKFHGIKIW
jgi:SH3 domain protein